MKAILVITLFALIGIITCYNGPSFCLEPMEVGHCRARFERWYFNKDAGVCELFIYGGCGGNENNFLNEDDCRRSCMPELFEASNLCSLPPETGHCKALMPMYYYDSASGTCKDFVYGGCGGNANRFETIEACQKRCS